MTGIHDAHTLRHRQIFSKTCPVPEHEAHMCLSICHRAHTDSNISDNNNIDTSTRIGRASNIIMSDKNSNDNINIDNISQAGLNHINISHTKKIKCDTVLCAPLGKSIATQFIVKTSCMGEWTRTLLDTGATVSFIDKSHVNNILTNDKSIIVSKDANLIIRLGNNTKENVTDYIDANIIIDGRETSVLLYIMQLPVGIDCILGLDWMTDQQVLLDTYNRRIIYANYEDTSKHQYGTLNSLISIHTLMPMRSETKIKSIQNKVYNCLGSKTNTDVHVVSHNCMNKLMNVVKSGSLTYNTYILATQPEEAGTRKLVGDVCFLDMQTSRLNNITKKVILKARNKKAREMLARHGGLNKVNKLYIKRLIKQAKSKSKKSINSLNYIDNGSLSVKYKAMGKARAHHGATPTVNSNTNDNNNINPFNTVPSDDETCWVATVIISPKGTITIPDFDSKTGKLTQTVSNSKYKTVFEEAAAHILKTYPSQSSVSRESETSYNIYNSASDLPIPCNIAPEQINTTDPAAKDWIKHLLEGKIEKFTCMNTDVKYNPLPTDIPHKVKLKEGATVPVPHRYRTPENLVPELRKFIMDMLQKGWIEVGDTEFNAPVLILKKPGTYDDGSSKGYRMCSDFRALNTVVEPVSHYMPSCDEMWEKLRHANYISVCDMVSGYWNMPVSIDSRKYLGIMTPWNVYRYKVLPMGYINASFVFQRFLERKLRKHGLLYEQINITNNHTDSDDNLSNSNKDPNNSHMPDYNDKAYRKYLNGNRSTEVPKKESINMFGFVSCYQDDIVCWSKTLAEHKLHLLKLLRVLSLENIPLNMKKSQFACRYVRYLGCVVGSQSLMMDPHKLSAIENMVVKKDITGIRSFLGCTGFYRRWIEGYAHITRPLTQLTKKDTNVQASWNSSHDEAVLKLKQAMMTYPILRQPMNDRPYMICSDSSKFATGAVLCQKWDDKWCAVAYVSRLFRGPELNYSVQEWEALGIIYALKKFNHYICATPHLKIRLYSDHQSLQFMHTQKGLSGRMARWAMTLADYNCEVKYIKGTSNVVADALSRLMNMQDREFDSTRDLLSMYPELHPKIYQDLVMAGALSREGEAHIDDMSADVLYLQPDDWYNIGESTIAEPHEQILFNCNKRVAELNMYKANICVNLDIPKHKYLACKKFGPIYRALHDDYKSELSDADLDKIKNDLIHYFIEGGLLYYSTKSTGETLAIPEDKVGKGQMTLRNKIIDEVHSIKIGGHRGIEPTYKALRMRFYWPNMKDTVGVFMRSCEICQMTKHERKKPQGKLQPLQIPLSPGISYSMDFKTNLPTSGKDKYDTLLVIVDRFSKRVVLIPTWSTATAKLTAELFFNRVVSQKGVPVDIVSDRDPLFTSNFWRSLWQLSGTTLTMSTSRHQNTDGQSENCIRSIEEILRGRVNYKQDNWASEIASIEFALNNTVTQPLGMSPFMCETGRNPIIPIDLTKNNLIRMQNEKASSASDMIDRIHNSHATARDSLLRAQANMTRHADKRRRVVQNMVVGGKCYLKLEGIELAKFSKTTCKKLRPLWFGPLMILKKISPVSFQLRLPPSCTIHDVFHVDRLKPANDPPPGLPGNKIRSLPNLDRGQRYEVEGILDEKLRYNKSYLLIRWKGYSELFDNSWEPLDEIQSGAPRILKKWRKDHAPL